MKPAEVIPIFDLGDFETHIARGVDALKSGGVIVLPTETVYGVAGILNHADARKKLHEIRGGDSSKPLTIHMAHRDGAAQYLGPVSELGKRMMKKLWPGPVALVFDVPADRRKEVASKFKLNESDLYHEGTITLRNPDHIVASEIIGQIDAPVVLTQTGGGSPAYKIEQISPELGAQMKLVFDAGPSRYSKPSTIIRVKNGGYEIVRNGVYDERIIQRLLRTTVLFVCSGNTCRSPMAEGLARKILAAKLKVSPNDLESKGVSVLSAGSFAMPGARATPQAVEALKDMGADLTKHRSRPLSVELIHQADAIFGMTKGHTQAVIVLVPSAIEKTSTLDPRGDIDDPIGSDVTVYRNLAIELEKLIEKRLAETVDL